MNGRPPLRELCKLRRRVRAHCCIQVDTTDYSVPWRLIGETAQVTVAGGRVVVRHAGRVVADHAESGGRRHRIVEARHFHGVAGHAGAVRQRSPQAEPVPPAELLRPLAEYELAVGGGW